MTQSTKKRACINCINLLFNDNVYSCDYEYWDDSSFEELIFLVPEFYNCDKYEEQI